MVAKRVVVGTLVGTLVVAAAFALPAAGAPGAATRSATLSGAAQIFFTPASADPRLAALIARNGLGSAPFRFTPAESRGDHRSTATALPIVVKAGIVTLRNAPTIETVGVAPIAYTLAGNSPAKRLVLADITKVDLGTTPGPRRMLDIGTSLSPRRNSKLKALTDRPNGIERLTGTPTESIDVGGSYTLSRNIDVTAGLRYKAQDRDRLAPLADDRRDSQAVYVGTAFRF